MHSLFAKLQADRERKRLQALKKRVAKLARRKARQIGHPPTCEELGRVQMLSGWSRLIILFSSLLLALPALIFWDTWWASLPLAVMTCAHGVYSVRGVPLTLTERDPALAPRFVDDVLTGTAADMLLSKSDRDIESILDVSFVIIEIYFYILEMLLQLLLGVVDALIGLLSG